jgi:DNA modification methylase
VKFPRGTTIHPINKHRKKEVLVSVWDFGPVPWQKARWYYANNNHPAKFTPSIIRAILQIYGKKPTLDPMCGVGTTNVEASLLGIKNWGMDYEQKYVNRAKANIKALGEKFPNKKLGKSTIIKGDARHLPFNKNKFGIIAFSPPYFNAISHRPRIKAKWYKSKRLMKTHQGYSAYKNNIGNSKDYQGYLKDMLQVYSECFRVLKPGRFCVVIVKDLRRKRLIVPLGCDTVKLLSKAGFGIFDIIINNMYFLSFWMLHHAIADQQKHIPTALKTHEYVIVAKKPENK